MRCILVEPNHILSKRFANDIMSSEAFIDLSSNVQPIMKMYDLQQGNGKQRKRMAWIKSS